MEIHDRRISDFLLTQAWGGARAHKSPAKPQAFSPSCLSSTRFLSGSVYRGPGGWGGPRADHTLSCQRRRPWARGVTGRGPRPERRRLEPSPLLAFSVRTPGQTAGPGQSPCGPTSSPALVPESPVTVITADGTLPEPDASPPRERGTSREGGLGDPPRASNPSSANNVATEDGGPSDDDVSQCCAEIFRSAALGQSCSGAGEQPSTSPKTQGSVPQAIHLFTNLLSKIFVALETSISENIPFLFFCSYFMPLTHSV